MAKYPTVEELPALIGVQHSMEQRVANLMPLYEAISEQDERLFRAARDIERKEKEIGRLKAEISRYQRELRSRPKTPEQLREIIVRSERRGEVLTEAWVTATHLLESVQELVRELESVSEKEGNGHTD